MEVWLGHNFLSTLWPTRADPFLPPGPLRKSLRRGYSRHALRLAKLTVERISNIQHVRDRIAVLKAARLETRERLATFCW